MTDDLTLSATIFGRCLTARAGRHTARATLRCLGYSATIAIAWGAL
jgi:hypothetical protein